MVAARERARHRRSVGGACILLLSLAACSGDDASFVTGSTGSTSSPTTGGVNVCIPGQQVWCACPNGVDGAQVCSPDGDSLGECMCPDSGTTTGEPADTTADDTTGGDSTTGGDTTTGDPTTSDSTGTGSVGECIPPCADDEVCWDGWCEPICNNLPGSYEPCDHDLLCPPGQFCLVDDVMDPTVGVCTAGGCTDPCDCPDAPVGFANACADLTGGGAGQCNIPCPGGAACPDGMECLFDLCFWPRPGDCCTANDAPGCDDAMCEGIVCGLDFECCGTGWDQDCADLAAVVCPGVCEPPQYGDCVNGGACPPGQTCITDAGVTVGWCSELNCAADAECQPPPPTGDAPALCGPINVMEDACLLDCSGGQTCPDGMACYMGWVCVWEAPPAPAPATPPYGDCIDNPTTTCQPGETSCLTDGGVAPSGGACSRACLGAIDCSGAPPTGDAPVSCLDLDGAGSRCLLDCSGGQTCPDGMACTTIGAGAACLWPDQGYVLDEDFELGVLRPGWTVVDVDGLVPAAGVAFVTDAFVVADPYEPGANFGAYSTSWYAPPGQADDWLISPAIELGVSSTLSWEAWAPDPAFADGYEVRISTGGPTVMELLANPPLFSIADEAQVFTPHAVDLAMAGYQNQVVHIGFRNDSNDDFVLVIDDIQVTQ